MPEMSGKCKSNPTNSNNLIIACLKESLSLFYLKMHRFKKICAKCDKRATYVTGEVLYLFGAETAESNLLKMNKEPIG